MQFWSDQADAERYARSRPFFHDVVAERIRARIGLVEPVALALDVGSGSGQSAAALTALARMVIAIDPSMPMLRSATDSRPRRLQAVGESLPVVDRCCDLITVALSFHWLDRSHFLSEASRVLRAAGWLVIYNDFFLGQMRENAAFQTWQNEQYLTRFPVPPRKDEPLTDAQASACGLTIVERQTYSHEVTFDVEELSSYLMTQTNVIAAVRSGAMRRDDARRWLRGQLSELFPAPRCSFAFGGFVWYLRTRSTN